MIPEEAGYWDNNILNLIQLYKFNNTINLIYQTLIFY